MIEQILPLREQGYSFRKIARELDTTVGKVQYCFRKYEETKDVQKNDNNNENPPTVYREDECTIIAQGPTVIYAYWDISLDLEKMVEHQCRTSWAKLRKVVRVYDVTMILFNGHNAHRYFDIGLPEMTNNWFVRDLEPNCTYVIDVGVESKQGTFLSLLRSNPIDTPRRIGEDNNYHVDAVMNWKNGHVDEPQWLEHFSTYSYYEKLK